MNLGGETRYVWIDPALAWLPIFAILRLLPNSCPALKWTRFVPRSLSRTPCRSFRCRLPGWSTVWPPSLCSIELRSLRNVKVGQPASGRVAQILEGECVTEFCS